MGDEDLGITCIGCKFVSIVVSHNAMRAPLNKYQMRRQISHCIFLQPKTVLLKTLYHALRLLTAPAKRLPQLHFISSGRVGGEVGEMGEIGEEVEYTKMGHIGKMGKVGEIVS